MYMYNYILPIALVKDELLWEKIHVYIYFNKIVSNDPFGLILAINLFQYFFGYKIQMFC